MARSGAGVRPERVAEQVRIEIAEILQRDLKDPRIGLVTCTRVLISRDLKVAKIYVSVLGSSEEQERAMEALRGASGFVRRLLWQRLRLRASPEVRFLFDPAVEYGIKLEGLIQEVHRREAQGGSPTEGNDEDDEEPTDES